MCINYLNNWIYLDSVDEEYVHFVNGVGLAPISYGTRYLHEEVDQNSEEIFYNGIKNSGIHWT